MSISEWIGSERSPEDFYVLLGRGRFDPHTAGVAAAIRAATRELLGYQNHRDAAVARRAAKLLWELGRAKEIISDAGKLRRYHHDMMLKLREEYAQRHGADYVRWEVSRLANWLERQKQVHPSRAHEVAEALKLPVPDIDSLPALVPDESDVPLPTSVAETECVATIDDVPVLQLAESDASPPKPARRAGKGQPARASTTARSADEPHLPGKAGAMLELLNDPELANMGITPLRVAIAAGATLVVGLVAFIWVVWPRATQLNIGTFPPGALLTVNGVRHGAGPVQMRFTGRATIVAELEGYETEQLEVDVSGQRKDVSLVLRRKSARYTIDLRPSHADLKVAGVSTTIDREGTMPVVVVSNPDGKRTVTISAECPDYLPAMRTMVPRPGAAETVVLHLVAIANRIADEEEMPADTEVRPASGELPGQAAEPVNVPIPPPQMTQKRGTTATSAATPIPGTRAPLPGVRAPGGSGPAAPAGAEVPGSATPLGGTVWKITKRGGGTQIWTFEAGGAVRRFRTDPNLDSGGSWTQTGDDVVFTLGTKVPVRHRGRIVNCELMQGTAAPLVRASSSRSELIEKPNARVSWVATKLKKPAADASAERPEEN
jgi:hypothetical protein